MHRYDFTWTAQLALCASVFAGVALGVTLSTGWSVFADGNPATDTVPRTIPYQGVLEFNGNPVNASGANAIPVQFELYTGPSTPNPVYSQRIDLEVFSGRFTAIIGPIDDGGLPLVEVIQAADDLHIGMTLLNAIEDPTDDVTMAHRQRIMASPYSMWSTSATNFTVASDLRVEGALRPSVGNANAAGIVFPSNPGGGTGDAAWIKYYVENGENTRLQIGISNNQDDDLELVQGGQRRIRIHENKVQVTGQFEVYDHAIIGSIDSPKNLTVTGTIHANTRIQSCNSVQRCYCTTGEMVLGGGAVGRSRSAPHTTRPVYDQQDELFGWESSCIIISGNGSGNMEDCVVTYAICSRVN